jgi:hypothetical protein
MKTLYSLFILFFLVFAISCETLDEVPEDIVSSNVIEEDDALTARMLNAAYFPFGNGYTYYDRAFLLPILLASDDHYFTRSTQADRINIDQFYWSPSYVYWGLFWGSAYSGIASCNFILDFIDPDAVSKDVVDNVLGQAYFLRALHYFNLVRYFGEIPLILDSDLTQEELVQVPQSPIDSVYAQIVRDLLKAQNLKSKFAWDTDNLGRASKGAAVGLLAKVYAYMASPGVLNKPEYWQKAADVANDLYLHASEWDVELLHDFGDLWLTKNEYNAEILFEASFNNDPINKINGAFYTQNRPYLFEDVNYGVQEGWGWNVGEMELYNSFADDDLRKEATFETYWIVDKDFGGNGPLDDTLWYYELPDSTPHAGKFRDPGDDWIPPNTLDGINFPILRYADVLLILAEAENEANNQPTTLAYTAVNIIRRRAFGDQNHDFTGLNYEQFRDSVRAERRRELAWEGDKWFDLVRWDIHTTIPNLIYKGVGNHKYFPIPQAEIDKSGGILKQNENIP